MAQWEKDSPIDLTEPAKELVRVPKLHSKYLNILTTHNLRSRKLDADLKKLRRLKWRYYTGKLDAEELKQLGWAPFQYILKQDVELFMESDDDLVKLGLKKAYHDEFVEYCTKVIKELNSRTYQLRAVVEWEKFTAGH